MLPMALDALLDVMTTNIDEDRLEKERAAVLSEASMVNKIEYRVECQILSSLHSENRISSRFPIGKEHLIKSWTKQDLQLYHQTHYRPDNVILFVVGDVDISTTVETIKQKFGQLVPRIDAAKLLKESGEFPEVSMRSVSRHFPPVTHRWSCSDEDIKMNDLLPAALIKPVEVVNFEKGLVAAPVSTSFTAGPAPVAMMPSKDTPPLLVTPAAATATAVASTAVMEVEEVPVTAALSAPLLASELPTTEPAIAISEGKLSPLFPSSKVFAHELLQSFSFHLFAKRPIEPVVTEASLKRELMRRMTLSALQIRLNVQQRNEPLFTFIDFNQLNWPREGCAVCSLDLTTDIQSWRRAVVLAVREIRRLGLFGLTDSEISRYKQAILAEAAQNAAQSEQRNNEEVLNELMESEACGHTFMQAQDRYLAAEKALTSITRDDVQAIARELCEHLSHMQPEKGVKPVALIACAPLIDRNGANFSVSEAEIASAVEEAMQEPLEALEDSVVPSTLISKELLQEKVKITRPQWVPLDGKALKDKQAAQNLGIVQRKLTNGIKVNMLSLNTEPQRAVLRLYVPGGRMRESRKQPGAVLVGSRTIQEGGAFLDVTREDVELFCIDHLLMVDITATEEALIFDFQTVTTPGPSHEGSTEAPLTGLEAVMQVAHIILTDLKYEQDAFDRARQGFHEQFDSIVKGLESACVESLTYSLTGGDARFLCPNHKQIDSLTLDDVKNALRSQLVPANIEVSISGDISIKDLEVLVLQYFGTVPVPKTSPAAVAPAALPPSVINVKTLGRAQQLGVYLPDSDERAMGYLAGPSTNRWGVFANGETLSEVIKRQAGAASKKDERREHPLFGLVAMLILQEVANRRLFSVVREERQLTYDASFQIQGHESILGGWYLVSVTSSPSQVQDAIRACKEALSSLKNAFGVMGDSVQSAKRTILNRFKSDSVSNLFWVDNMSGSQVDCIPFKNLRSITDFESVVFGITVQDIQLLVDVLQFDEDSMTSCVGITAPEPPPGMK